MNIKTKTDKVAISNISQQFQHFQCLTRQLSARTICVIDVKPGRNSDSACLLRKPFSLLQRSQIFCRNSKFIKTTFTEIFTEIIVCSHNPVSPLNGRGSRAIFTLYYRGVSQTVLPRIDHTECQEVQRVHLEDVAGGGGESGQVELRPVVEHARPRALLRLHPPRPANILSTRRTDAFAIFGLFSSRSRTGIEQ